MSYAQHDDGINLPMKNDLDDKQHFSEAWDNWDDAEMTSDRGGWHRPFPPSRRQSKSSSQSEMTGIIDGTND